VSEETYIVGWEGGGDTSDECPLVWGCVALRRGDELVNPTTGRTSPWKNFDELIADGHVSPTPVEMEIHTEVKILAVVKVQSVVFDSLNISRIIGFCEMYRVHDGNAYIAFKDMAEFDKWAFEVADCFATIAEDAKVLVKAGLILQHDNERLIRLEYSPEFAQKLVDMYDKKKNA
jgi:hypothetical protein